MNKNELIDSVAGKSEMTKSQVAEIMDFILKGIEEGLKKDGEVKFTGFGTFKVSRREASMGRNPATGEAIKIAASNRVKFAAGKELKESVNE